MRRHDPSEFGRYVGMAIFLGTLGMFFAAFLLAYGVLRLNAPAWPPAGEEPLPVALPGFNAVVILASSYTLARALRAARADAFRDVTRYLAATFGLGVAFVLLQCVLWAYVWSGGWFPSTGRYHTTFYALTAIHALHVIPGVVCLGFALRSATRRRYTSLGHVPLRLVSMYWHFIDAVWLVMFVGLFVL